MKKSLYVFMSSIMGVFLFFLLHRLAFFFWAVIASATESLAAHYYSLSVLVFEYITLLLALLGGAWYGIWLGIYWYEKVYEEGSHYGWVHHIGSKFWAGPNAHGGTTGKILAATRRLEEDLLNLEDLAAQQPALEALRLTPIKRTLVRNKTTKKLSKK